MKLIFKLLNLLLPVALFVLVLPEVQRFFDNGESLIGVGIVLGSLAIMAVWEGLLLKLWILPACSRALSERVYSASYSPDEDPLVAMAERIRREHAVELMPEFEQLVRKEARRPRAWAELASLLTDELDKPEEALKAFLNGAEHVSRKEDKALFLCRAAHLCEKRLKNEAEAARLYAEAAAKYPGTAYGRKAAERAK